MNKKDPTQGIPVWLQPFTANVEDLEAHVLAHSFESENSDSEGGASKVETQKRKHSVHAYFRIKQKRSILLTEKYDNSRAHIFSEGCESRNNQRYASVVQVLATQWSLTEDMDEFGKVGADVSYLQSQMHSENDSEESFADSVLEDGELRRMLTSPLYLQNREDYESSRMPIATVTHAAILQERGASAKRTQADSRKGLISSSSQEPSALEKLAATFSFGSEEPGNQF